MGTNFYWYAKEKCNHCDREYDPIHIGKSTYGWVFSLHITNEIKSLDDWKAKWQTPGSYIKNSYGDIISIEEMLNIIENRKPAVGNKLLRHNFETDSQLVNRGSGTWDCFSGEFS